MTNSPARALATLLLAACVPALRAQSSFLKFYDTSVIHLVHSMTATTDGGYLLAAVHNDAQPTEEVSITKVDAQGAWQWSELFSSIAITASPEVVALSDGGALVLAASDFLRDLLVIRLDPFGDTLWTRAYDQPIQTMAVDAVELANGDLVLLNQTHARVYLTRTNAQGDIIWSNDYAGTSPTFGTLFNYRADLKLTSDGNLIACASIPTDGPIESNGFIVKVDLSGALLWGRFLGGDDEDNLRQVVETADGGYLATGYHFTGGMRHAIAVRLANDGTILWQRMYAANEGTTTLILGNLPDGGHLIGGHAYYGTPGYRALLLKIDDQGDPVWCNTYGPDLLFMDAVFTGNSAVFATAKLVTGTYPRVGLLAQDTAGTSTCEVSPYVFTVSDPQLATSTVVNVGVGTTLLQAGMTVTSLTLAESLDCISTGIAEVVPASRPLIAPNPAQGYCSVNVPSGRALARLDIVDCHGRTAEHYEGGVPTSIDLSSLQPGLYLFRMAAADGTISVQRVVVE